MFNLWLLCLALIHLAALGGLLWRFCRRTNFPLKDRPVLIFLGLWANTVLTGHLASIFGELGNLAAYIAFSFISLGGIFAALHLVAPNAKAKSSAPPLSPLVAKPKINFALPLRPKGQLVLKRTLITLLCLTCGLSFILGASIYPDNADSMIYRLPRAFWYVTNGSFLHPFESFDKRMTFYPLDGVALYVPLVLYQLPGTAHAIPTMATFLLIGYVAYRFARSLGADKLIALSVVFLLNLTPGIMAQSIATNDEILAAGALLAGVYMGWRWLLTADRRYFVLAFVGAGLSVGTKLHIVFLTPILLAGLALLFWHLLTNKKLARTVCTSIGWKSAFVTLILTTTLITPFMIYNYLSTGHIYFVEDFADQVFNLKASLQTFKQNFLIYFAQMALSPIADLNIWPYADDRQIFNNFINSVFNPLLAPLISPEAMHFHMNYRYNGIVLPTSVRFVEFSLWSGFVWLLWPFQILLAYRQKFSAHALFILCAATPLSWFFLWCATTRYMEGTATYFTFYLICAAPAAAFAFARISSPFWNKTRWLCLLFVAVTNLIICINLFNFSGFRSLPFLFSAQKWPYDWDLLAEPVIDELRRAKYIRLTLTHEKMPYFAFMHWNPSAKYYSSYPERTVPPRNNFLRILPASSLNYYGFMPLRITDKNTTGLTYLGTMRAIGNEAIFAFGNNVDKRHPDQSNYILPKLLLKQNENKFIAIIEDNVPGLFDDDHLQFAYSISVNNQVVFTQNWSDNVSLSAPLPADPNTTPTTITIKVREANTHKNMSEQTYNIAGPLSWLPASPDDL